MVSASEQLGALSSQEWQDLCDRAGRLEETLSAGAASVDLRDFLPSPEAQHRRAVLCELVKTEMEVRYRQGHGVWLDEFCERYPELGGREGLPADLIYEEYRVRRLYGDRPDLGSYRERFPSQFEQVQQLVRQNPVPEPKPQAEQPTPSDYHTLVPSADGPQPVPAPSPPPKPAKTNSPAPAATFADPNKVAAPSTPFQSTSDLVLTGGLGYQKLERLGRGEFGEVWRALAPGGVEVAVKIITRTLDHEASQRELKVLEKIRQLRHPFLLQAHQYQAERDHLVIVMELADGSLSDRFKECKAKGLPGIPAEELVTYFTQAAEALDFLHTQHLAHRDIKPQNLLRLRGYAKLADFGLARQQDRSVDDASMLCGTPHYMAPEVWRGQISMHSDQYSLAATYVEMRLGRRVFSGKTPFEIAENHIKSEPQLDPLPAAEQAVLKRALAKDPSQRFPTCVAFAKALQEAVLPKKVEPPPTNWRARALVGSLALALVVMLCAFVYVKTRPEPIWLPSPPGWRAENANDLVTDPTTGHKFYRRIVRDVNGQKVVMIAIPPSSPADPPLFYIMENKVWNDLYAAFMASPEAERLFEKYRSREGGDQLFSKDKDQWKDGADAPGARPPRLKLGVGEGRGRMPVFRVTVTEAHCFAEWLGGRLPKRIQWLKAAGALDPNASDGPFDGPPDGIAVNLGKEGPWPVDQGQQDVSVYGCRQVAGNGKEWTRTMQDPETLEIPLLEIISERPVLTCGQSYLAQKPLTYKDMMLPNSESCFAAKEDISFRIVLQP
jgi:serine/threonine protein kinase